MIYDLCTDLICKNYASKVCKVIKYYRYNNYNINFTRNIVLRKLLKASSSENLFHKFFLILLPERYMCALKFFIYLYITRIFLINFKC